MQIEQGEIPVVSSLLGQGMRAKTEGDRISCRCLLSPIGTAFCQQMSSFPRPARRTEHIIISTESGEMMSPVITRGKVHQRPRAIRLLRLRLPEEITHTADTQRKLQYVIPGWKHDMFPLCNTVRTVVEASVGKCTNKPHHERGGAAASLTLSLDLKICKEDALVTPWDFPECWRTTLHWGLWDNGN
ncbi:hypothetical protein J6590_023080 [Homalodisca vitripennis]|nr:hypothetical protein J6590_023080 [Homalodisca vitripennis]